MLHPEAIRYLQDARRNRKTGRLEATSATAGREIFLREGAVVGIRTSVEAERLGNILVRLGRITRQHFEDASIFVRHGWRIGQILAELKIIESAEIEPMLRLQAMEVGCAVLAAPEARVRFEETQELFLTLEASLAVPDVIMEAARRIGDAGALRKELSSDTRRFHPMETSVVAQCTTLTPQDVYLLSRFQGGATPEAVLSSSNLEESAAARAVFGLVACGILATDEGAGAGMVRDKVPTAIEGFGAEVERMFRRLERNDPWRALELPPDVGIETAHAAFRKAVRRYHPDRHHNLSDPEIQRKLAVICERFTTAFTCLTTALQMRGNRRDESAIPLASTHVTTSPPPADAVRPEASRTRPPAPPSSSTPPGKAAADAHATLPPCDPDVYYREGKRAMAQGDYWRAIELLRVAVRERSDRAAYHALLAEALAKNPRWRRDAEQSYRRAIELEPYRTDHYLALGRLYATAGMAQRAESLFRQARELGVPSGGAGESHEALTVA